MSAGLVRTTTYFDENLFRFAKKQAFDEGVPFYAFINNQLGKVLNVKVLYDGGAKVKKPFKLEDVFGPPMRLGLKNQNLTRADYYDE